MSRYNIFNQIHKGLRVLLYDTAATLSRTDFDDAEQYNAVTIRVKEVMDMFDNHAHHEDTLLFPLIEGYEPAVVDAFEQEHVTDHALGQKLRGSIMALDLAVDPNAKKQLGTALIHSFIEFMIFNLQHMHKEETVINNFLWKYYSDEELLNTNKKIVASIPPQEINFASQWMMKGLNNTEISVWLRGVERSAPEQVFRSLLNTAEKELEHARFRKILEGLSEGLMIAS
jgi:hemerythrin-like domain-containing protein